MTGSTITVTFTDAGATRWADVTTRSVGRMPAILANDVVLIAPQIHEPIHDGTAILSGGWSFDEARSLAALITGQ